MSGWNYRILRHKDGTFAVHEVYYHGDKIAWTKEPVPEGLTGESFLDLLSMIDGIYKGSGRPVIDEEKTIQNGYQEVNYTWDLPREEL